MLSSFHYTMLKLSKTTSSDNLFDYDCVTLYRRTLYYASPLMTKSYWCTKVVYFRHQEKNRCMWKLAVS